MSTIVSTIVYIPVDLIDPHPHNPRHELGDLTELAKSIETQGIVQNLLVTPWGDKGRYRAIIGHRRLAAAQIACLAEVPAVIDEQISAEEQIELMLLENLQRTNISPIEEAEGYQQLLDLGMKPAAIAKATGRAVGTVNGRLKLLTLPAAAQAKVHADQASLEDAADLLKLEDHPAELEKVTAALGTDNFDWALKQANERIALDKKMAPLYAEVERLGATRGTSSWSTHNTLGSATTMEEVAGHAPFPEGTIYTTASFSPRLYLYTPKSAEEVAAANQYAQPSAVITDEQRAAWAEERRIADELRDQINAEGVQAAELRDQWIRDFAGRKRILAKESLAILATVGPAALLSDSLYVDINDVASWLGLERGDWDSEADVLKALDEECPSGDRSLCLLILLHLSTRNSYWGSSDRDRVALYSLLEQLGYPVSDAERARITPPAEDEAVEA